MDKSLIISKIKEYLKFKTDTEFADFLGVKQNTISSWRSRNTIDYELIITKCDYINANWLLTGEGDMLKEKENLPAAYHINNDNEGIPLLPIDALAGVLTSGTQVQVMDYDCEKYIIPMFKNADFLIPVRGTSMQPKYNSGDVVACRKLESWSFFQYGKVYVIYTDQDTIIKRVYEGHDDAHISLVSDNVERYKPFELHKQEIKGVAIVVGVVRLE